MTLIVFGVTNLLTLYCIQIPLCTMDWILGLLLGISLVYDRWLEERRELIGHQTVVSCGYWYCAI